MVKTSLFRQIISQRIVAASQPCELVDVKCGQQCIHHVAQQTPDGTFDAYSCSIGSWLTL